MSYFYELKPLSVVILSHVEGTNRVSEYCTLCAFDRIITANDMRDLAERIIAMLNGTKKSVSIEKPVSEEPKNKKNSEASGKKQKPIKKHNHPF